MYPADEISGFKEEAKNDEQDDTAEEENELDVYPAGESNETSESEVRTSRLRIICHVLIPSQSLPCRYKKQLVPLGRLLSALSSNELLQMPKMRRARSKKNPLSSSLSWS